jgi:cyclophilin family peptidyl-prolyl cis-trans isomerase
MSYTIFGQVIYGLDVIDKIASAATDENDRPLKDIKMKITLLKKSEYRKYK